MVKIKKNFNAEMEDYISRVKKNTETEKVKKEIKKETKTEVKINQEELKEKKNTKKSIFQKFIDFITGEEDMEEENEEEIEKEENEKNNNKEVKKSEEKELKENEKKEEYEERKGFFEKIKSWFSGDDEISESEEEYEKENTNIEKLPEDIKNILKIQNKWLTKLPKESLQEFKNSEDYKTYKETLKKYNLIK